MRRFIFLIVVLLVSVWVGLKISADPGLALFSWREWTVEMPLWVALVILVVFLILFYFVLRLLGSVDSSFSRWKNWLRLRRRRKSYSKTNRGLLELIEGRWRTAESCLLEGIDQSEAPLINYLAAAKAAHERHSYDKRDLYLRKAHDLAPKADVAIGLTQAKLQFDQGQLEQALATLNHLRSLAPLHVVVLRLLEKVYVRLADWRGLLKLIPSLRKAKLVTAEQQDLLEQHAFEELIMATAAKSANPKDLQAIWSMLPRRLRNNARVVYCYTRQLLKFPNTSEEAETLINDVIKSQWDSDLVRLYGQFVITDAKKQLNHAEKWLKRHNQQAVLLLTLGKLSLHCQLWGKAREYFEASLRLAPSAECYFEYAKLLNQLGENELALRNYRQGADLDTLNYA